MQQSGLNDLQVDALREIASIGSGHAATVLSQMTNRRIMIDVPEVNLFHRQDIGARFQDNTPIVALSMRMLGDLNGLTAFVMPENGALLLADLLLGRELGTGNELGEMEQSGLKELGNIMASSFMNALAAFMGRLLLPSVPELLWDKAQAVLEHIGGRTGSEQLLLVETDFYFEVSQPDPSVMSPSAPAQKLGGVLLFVPDTPSIELIFSALLAA